MTNQSNPIQLDRYDRHILAVLQEDGRISNQDLADRIGLSPSPCLRRVRALEDAGLIRAYRALLDAKKLGLSLMALIGISMDQHTPERFASLEQAITVIDRIRSDFAALPHAHPGGALHATFSAGVASFPMFDAAAALTEAADAALLHAKRLGRNRVEAPVLSSHLHSVA